MQIHRVLLYMQSNTGDKKKNKTKQKQNKTKQTHTHTHTHTQTDLGRPARLHTIESNHLWSAS